MGVYTIGKRPYRGLIWANPSELARRVVESWSRVVQEHIDTMADRYENDLMNWTNDRDKQTVAIDRLAEYYEALREISPELKRRVAQAKRNYRKRIKEVEVSVYV